MMNLEPFGKLGFGGAPLGNMYTAIDDATAEAVLVAAWESGARHFDTAPVYGRGWGELRFGHVLRRYPREEFVLSTKVGRLMRGTVRPRPGVTAVQGTSEAETSVFASALPFEIEVDYGYDAAMRSLEDSYQRFGMSQIDIVYVHDLGADHLGDGWEEQFEVACAGAFRALTELRDQGVIKAWGLGNNVVEPGIRALERVDPDVLQISGRYSLLDQSALDRLFPLCARRGVAVVLGGTYNSGLLAGGSRYNYHPAPAEMVAKRDRIDGVCRRHEVDIRAAALQFSAAHPVVSTIIPGSQKPEEARENARLMMAPIPPALWVELKAEGLIRHDAPVPD